LDARSTWFERLSPPAEPLAEKVIGFPVEPCFELADQSIHFRGYRLDRAGYPSFLYQFGVWNVDDRLEVGPSTSLRRTLVVRDSRGENDGRAEADLFWIAHGGKELQRVSANSVVDEQGLIVTILEGIEEDGELNNAKAGQRWVFPLNEKRDYRITLEYQW
jgi:hypothetical protein